MGRGGGGGGGLGDRGVELYDGRGGLGGLFRHLGLVRGGGMVGYSGIEGVYGIMDVIAKLVDCWMVDCWMDRWEFCGRHWGLRAYMKISPE